MTYPLTIAAPRSARWYELEHDARARGDGATDYGDQSHITSSHTRAGRVLAWLRSHAGASTPEVAAAIGLRWDGAYHALRILSEEGLVQRVVRRRQSASGHLHSEWTVRA